MAKKTKDKEIRVRNVPDAMNEQLTNLATNTGTNVSALIKVKIGEYLASVPEHLKKDYRD
jgi:predicted DNA-binding protein